MAADANNLIWIDMEMTGLQPDADRVIEIAMLVTDPQLNVLAQEGDRLLLRLGLGEARGAHLVDQARLLVRALVPGVHRLEHLVGLVQHQQRALGDDAQLGVGHQHGDLDDAVGVGRQPGHLHVDPDEVVRIAGHALFSHA